MLKQNSTSNENRVVRPFKKRIGGFAGGLDLLDDHGSDQPVRAARPDTPAYPCPPVAPVAEADSATDWWSAALPFVMDGFALYAASLYPNAAFSAEVAPTTDLARRPSLADGQPHGVTHQQGGSQPPKNGRVVELERAAWADLPPRRRWTWWAALGEAVAALLTHWRREWEIKRAVMALAKYDDRALRDIGINGRADIERVVRYGRDY